jgi:hypothetical protein
VTLTVAVMKYTWLPPTTYARAPDLRIKCQELIEKDPGTISARNNGINGVVIIGGVHEADRDSNKHLTFQFEGSTKVKHVPAPNIPTVEEYSKMNKKK